MIAVTPLHHHHDPAHLLTVIERMRTLGPPRVRAHLDVATGAWLAFEGTHRLRAALFLAVVPIMVQAPWRRGPRALHRARYATLERAHWFPAVEVAVEIVGAVNP